VSVLPEVAGCGGCAASVRIDWMAEEIGPGCHFGVVACEKCGLIRFAVAAESAEALAAGRAMVRFAFGADSVALYAEDG